MEITNDENLHGVRSYGRRGVECEFFSAERVVRTRVIENGRRDPIVAKVNTNYTVPKTLQQFFKLYCQLIDYFHK